MTTTEELCRNNLHPAEDRNYRGECKPCEKSARQTREESRVDRLKRLLRAAVRPEPGWQVKGLCGYADPTDWSLNDDPSLSGGAIEIENRSRHERAKRICMACPVRKACLDDALLNGDMPQGTWGGELFTSTDRDPMRQARKELASE